MHASLLWTFLIGVVCVSAKSLPLPSYITPCTRDEPDLNECARKRGQEAIPHIIKGDRKYKIPVMDPLVIEYLHVNEGVLGLNFTATNMMIRGLRNAKLDHVTWDTKANKGEYRVSIPRLEAIIEYSIDGRILILPVTGNGVGNLTFNDVTGIYAFDFEIEKRKDGIEYFLPKKSKLTFDTSRMYVHLDNLFNGNKLLGDQTNIFMNENWKDMVKELGPVLGDAVGEVFRRIQYNIFELVSYDDAFPRVKKS